MKFNNLSKFLLTKIKQYLSILIVKIICSVYNIGVAYYLSQYSNQHAAGELILVLSVVSMGGLVSRIGSDNYWLDSDKGTIRIVKNEVKIVAALSVIAGIISSFINDKVYIGKYIDYLIFIVLIFSNNIIMLSAKISQTRERHSGSLFFQLLGGGFLSVPLFVMGVDNILLAICISYLLLLPSAMWIIFRLGMFNIKDEPFIQRIHYMPNIINGLINQNYIAVLGAVLDALSVVPMLVYYQKLFGLIGWPAAMHLQKISPELSEKTRSREFKLFNIFASMYSVTFAIFVAGMFLVLAVNIYPSSINIHVLPAGLIMLASMASALSSPYPIIYGITRNGVALIEIMLLCIIIATAITLMLGISRDVIAFSFALYQFLFLLTTSIFYKFAIE